MKKLAKEGARTFLRAAVLASLDDLTEVGVDGIVIATPSALHAEWAVNVLGRGMAVFCQNLLGCAATKTRQVIDAARVADCFPGMDLLCAQRVDPLLAICSDLKHPKANTVTL